MFFQGDVGLTGEEALSAGSEEGSPNLSSKLYIRQLYMICGRVDAEEKHAAWELDNSVPTASSAGVAHQLLRSAEAKTGLAGQNHKCMGGRENQFDVFWYLSPSWGDPWLELGNPTNFRSNIFTIFG
jgi:hypothetical protein